MCRDVFNLLGCYLEPATVSPHCLTSSSAFILKNSDLPSWQDHPPPVLPVLICFGWKEWNKFCSALKKATKRLSLWVHVVWHKVLGGLVVAVVAVESCVLQLPTQFFMAIVCLSTFPVLRRKFLLLSSFLAFFSLIQMQCTDYPAIQPWIRAVTRHRNLAD